MTHDYSLQLAQKRVDDYRRKDETIAAHEDAMACRDCEDFLESGIEAFKWLRRADLTLREAAVAGIQVPDDAPEAIASLYRAWLVPCPHAQQRIKQQVERDFRLRNLREFQEACEYVKQQVRLLDMDDQLEGAFRGDVFDEAFWQEAHGLRAE